MRWLALALALVLVVAAACGGKKKTDAERAAEERAAARKRVDSSLVLVPYRGLKTVLRASKVTPPPPGLAPLVAALEPLRTGEPQPAKVAGLVTALLAARSVLKTIDEDGFPTLWDTMVAAPPPAPWYDGPAEHLALAGAAWLFDVALGRDPIADVLFYELDRGPAAPAWPAPLRVASRGARGLAYAQGGYHYAAEEELAAYIGEAAALPPDPTAVALEAGGHLARAWNRLALKRDEAAVDDLEAALAGLDKLGIDNELTDWAWAFVHGRRGRFAEARARLDKLAQSPNLGDAERAEVRAYAAELEKRKDAPFGRARAQLVLARALVARAGGVRPLLAALAGDETAGRVMAPLAWLTTFRSQLPDAGGLGRKGLDAVKSLAP